MKKIVCCFFALAIFPLFAITSHNLIIFGDSLSDIGNNYWVKVPGKVGSPIVNNDAHLGASLWMSYLLKYPLLGLPKGFFSSSFARQNHIDPTYFNIDYAWSSAETGIEYNDDAAHAAPYFPYNYACTEPGYSEGNACVPGLLQQIALYLKDIHNQPSPKTIYFLWAGGNDIFNNLGKLITALPQKNYIQYFRLLEKSFLEPTADSPFLLSTPILNIKKAVQVLLNHGILPAQIYLINLPDLSTVPAAIAFAEQMAKGNPVIKKLILELFKDISLTYNTDLLALLCADPLTRDKNIPKSHLFSIQAMLNEIKRDPEKFNFSSALLTHSCVADQKTPDCEHYLFFNEKHPTAFVHKMLGERLARMLTLYPVPG